MLPPNTTYVLAFWSSGGIVTPIAPNFDCSVKKIDSEADVLADGAQASHPLAPSRIEPA
jgi:hypothetical protein